MGLAQIDYEKVTSATGYVDMTGISSNNPHLCIISHVAPSNDNVSLYARVTKGGSPDDTSNYDQTYRNLYDQTYTIGNSFNASESYMNMGNCGTGTSEAHNSHFWLFNFNSGTYSSIITRTTSNISSDQLLYGQIGGTSHSVASASDGLRFYFSSGNIASGTFVLYEMT